MKKGLLVLFLLIISPLLYIKGVLGLFILLAKMPGDSPQEKSERWLSFIVWWRMTYALWWVGRASDARNSLSSGYGT